jgi:hypothetical protein
LTEKKGTDLDLICRRQIVPDDRRFFEQDVAPTNERLSNLWPKSTAMLGNLLVQVLVSMAHPRIDKFFPVLGG